MRDEQHRAVVRVRDGAELPGFRLVAVCAPHAHGHGGRGSAAFGVSSQVVFLVDFERDETGDALSVSFKCSPMSFEMLKQEPGLRPAPYLASRGMKWIQRFSDESMPDDVFRDYLRESHRLVAAGLTKRLRAELGL